MGSWRRSPSSVPAGSRPRSWWLRAEESRMSEDWTPRFNHVAMSIAREHLASPEWRQQVAAFYADVFGWQEVSQPGGDPLVLILLAYRPSQFVFLLPAKDPMQCPRDDHFGM